MGQTILTPNQRRLLGIAATDRIITNAFYLTGGTVLSEFYLHHRISEDLDFFSEHALKERDITAWVKTAEQTLRCDVTFQTLRGQLIYYFHFPHEVVKADFAYFPFPMIGEPMKYKQLRIASIEDIAVNKLQAILTRTRGRDYVDLYEIFVRKKISVEQLLRDYRFKFDITVPSEQLAKRLAAVQDASDQPRFIERVNWSDVEQFFVRKAKELVSKMVV